jgi:hypothetical protein
MRSTAWTLASLALALGAGEVRADDWRAVSTSHHDVVFVDADSVRRTAEGRISFLARHRLDENDSNRDFGYDRIDVAVEGRCADPGQDRPPASSRRSYRLKGRPVAAQDWREEDLIEYAGDLAADICDGRIGDRRFADLDSAMAEYREHDSLERLAAHVTGELDLVGTVVQGWEMNAVSLCESEEGCREDSPTEFCWLEGGISVPAPAGAAEWVDGGPRRDSAGAAFRGRVHRSREGKGFGHMGGYACLVEVTGPARFVAVPKRREGRPDGGSPPASPEAIAANRAFSESIKSAAKVAMAAGRRRWELDEFSAGTASLDACYSVPRFKGADLDFYAPVLAWRGIERISREGAQIVLASREYDPDLTFYFPDAKASRGAEAYLRKLSTRGVAAIAQKGAKVSVRYADGGNESFRFEDPASAVQAAGMAERLRGREIADLKPWGNQITATPLRRISLTFPDEALAQGSEERMQALRGACAG